MKGRDRQTEFSADPPHFGRSAVKRQEVVLEELDPVDPTDAAASSFSGRVPVSETVAIERGSGNSAGHTTAFV